MGVKTYSYLKSFKHLKVLNIRENPFAKKEQEYENHLIYHLQTLQYLDHIFITEERRNEVRGKFKEGDDSLADPNSRLKIEEEEQKKSTRKQKLDVIILICESWRAIYLVLECEGVGVGRVPE